MSDSILVFGGGPLQLSIIKQVNLMGFLSIVIDPDGDAPDKYVASKFFKVAGNDFTTTRQIAIENNVKGIITSATDKPILMMCRIAEALHFPFPSYQSCETMLDKARFKAFLKTNNFPHANGQVYQGEERVTGMDLNYPVIVKPVMNSGSRGVIKCERPEDLNDTISETIQHCNDKRFIIEEFIQGDEVSVEVLIDNHKVYVVQITDKIVTPPPYNVELGHLQPSKYLYLKDEITELLQNIADKTGLNHCALHPELKIDGDKITIIEIGPRLGGDFITSHLVPLSTGVNMEEQLIRLAVGLPLDFVIKPKASMVSYLNFPAGKKVLNDVSEEELKQIIPSIELFQCDLKRGDVSRQITHSLNRYGHFILSGTDTNDLAGRQKEILNYLENKLFTI